MSTSTGGSDAAEQRQVGPPGRGVAVSVVGLAGLLAAGLGFAVVLSLVATGWSPLAGLDQQVVAALNARVSDEPLVVTALTVLTWLGGAQAGTLLVVTLTVYLLVRRLPRLALYVAVTGTGAAVLNTGVKALVDRTRPEVDVPVATVAGLSFPSGHAMGSAITYGVLLLVFSPLLPPRRRRLATVVVVALVVLIGLTRVALGVHYPSDVLGGWLLGVLWLAVTAAAFHPWRVAEASGAAVEPSSAHDAPVPDRWRGAATLLAAAVMLWGALVGLGLLVTDVVPVRPVDVAVLREVLELRSPTLTRVVGLVDRLGDTPAVLAVLGTGVVVALATTRRWAPAVFLLLATVGQTVVFLAVSNVVRRVRPTTVDRIPEDLPASSWSFPSGHASAALALYGGIALLVWAWSRDRGRWLVVAVAALVVLGVFWSRLYEGVHYPSDVLASVLLSGAWLAVCWRVTRPGRGAPGATGAREVPEGTRGPA